MVAVLAREVVSGAIEQARDHSHMRRATDQLVSEVEIQVKHRRA